MYFEDLSMRRSINCASACQIGGFRSSEKIEPISAVCVLLVSRASLLFPWQTASNARKDDGSWNCVLKLSSCEVRHLKQLSVVMLQLHVNRLVQLDSFSSFWLTFLIFFTGRLWIVLACLREFSTYQHWSKLDALLSPIEFSSPGIKISVSINSVRLN